MKKLKIFIVLGFFAITVVKAQNSYVVSAFNYNKYGELDKAKEAIDIATSNESTSGKPKTWYYRGIIYHNIYETKEEKYKQLSANPLEEAVKSYQKAMELDTRKEYIVDLTSRLNVASIQFLNKGVGSFNENDFPSALNSFEHAIIINKTYFNIIDTLAMFNAGVAAEKSNNYEKAKEYYNELTKVNYGGAKIYSFLSSVYKASKDTVGAMDVIKRGRVAYPDDANLVIEELNFYLTSGKNAEALNNLNLAIQKEPNNTTLYFALGTVNDNLEKYDDAEKAYKKAIELDSNYFDAYFNLGALYFNRGVQQNNYANSIQDNTKYKAEITKADKTFKSALPYLEKALKLNPTDRNTMMSLKDLYARMGDSVKYQQMADKLKN